MCDCRKKPEIEEAVCKLEFATGALIDGLRRTDPVLPKEEYLMGAVMVVSEALGELWKVLEGK